MGVSTWGGVIRDWDGECVVGFSRLLGSYVTWEAETWGVVERLGLVGRSGQQ